MTTRLADAACPHCDTIVNAASVPGDDAAKPKPGDITICINCSGALIFDDLLVPRKPRQGEVEAMCILSPRLWDSVRHIQTGVSAFNAQKAKRTQP